MNIYFNKYFIKTYLFLGHWQLNYVLIPGSLEYLDLRFSAILLKRLDFKTSYHFEDLLWDNWKYCLNSWL